jgi:uncharacterized membrane protein (DUF485 family)
MSKSSIRLLCFMAVLLLTAYTTSLLLASIIGEIWTVILMCVFGWIAGFLAAPWILDE